MEQASILAETQSLTAVNGEVSDPDRGTPAMAETQSLTDVRGESSDPDRGIAFAETQTVTKTSNEASDPDAGAIGGIVDWERGDRRPLLFRDAVAATADAPDIGYDEALDMAVDADGTVLVAAGSTHETGTESAVSNETSDTDH